MLPEVPVKVTVGEADGTFTAAASVTVCGVPGTRLRVAGVAVTPAGSPDTETPTVPLKAFSELASTEIWAPDAPLMIVADAGVALSEKSGTGRGAASCLCSTPPHEMNASQQIMQTTRAADRPGKKFMRSGPFQSPK